MRILILGVSGMLGHMLYRVLSRSHDVFGTCRGPYDAATMKMVVLPERCFEYVRSEDYERLADVFRECRPNVVLNAIGVIKQKSAAGDAIEQIRVNSILPHIVAQCSEVVEAKLIQVSTDCVFSGHKIHGMYLATDIPDPIDLYGRSKLLGEVTHAPHLTLRTSIVGRQLKGSQSLFEWFIKQKGGRVQGYVNAIYSGLTTQALAALLEQLLNQCPELTGLYHVASLPISKYDLLVALNERLQLDILIEPETSFRCDRSLDGKEFCTVTGIKMPSWGKMLEEFAIDSSHYEIWRSAI